MKTQSRKVKIYVQYGVLLLSVMIILWITARPCPTGPMTASLYFIDQVWPPPHANIPIGCVLRRSISQVIPILEFINGERYQDDIKSSISIKIRPLTIVDELDSRREFSKRLLLYLDDKKGENPSIMLEDSSLLYAKSIEELKKMPRVPGWYNFGWYPFLLPGEHHARFVLVKNDGTIYEYEWSFTITWW